jgi:2-polyprenyl-3-methyl-5-hydroxy-6-metoxy-1,4-benzoquinol methylase
MARQKTKRLPPLSDGTNRIFTVMISSTFDDLQQLRVALAAALQQNNMTSIAMENDSPNVISVIESSLSMVKRADAYICIIGRRYGNIPESQDQNPNGFSLTELEFDQAMNTNKPILLFIMGDDYKLAIRQFDAEELKVEKRRIFAAKAKQMSNTNKVHRVYSVFNTEAEFKEQAYPAVARLYRHLSSVASTKRIESKRRPSKLNRLDLQPGKPYLIDDVDVDTSNAHYYISSPTLVLDSRHDRILDRNPAFECLFKTHLFRRNDSYSRFLKSLDIDNTDQTYLENIFAESNNMPLISKKRIHVRNNAYGEAGYTVTICQVFEALTARLRRWIISFNIDYLEKDKDIREDLQRVLRETQHWNLYAESYDPILTRFNAYNEFKNAHIEPLLNVGSRIFDLGAGTGNLTLDLLKRGKEVYALDSSDAMLRKLRKKCNNYMSRCRIIKQDIESMSVNRSTNEYDKFDGIVMMNVLSCLRNQVETLRKCHDLLIRGGALVISGPKQDVSLADALDVLRDHMKKDKNKLWDRYRDHYQVVRARNEYMAENSLLLQLSIQERVQQLEDIGFEVIKVIENGYTGDDMIIQARKK